MPSPHSKNSEILSVYVRALCYTVDPRGFPFSGGIQLGISSKGDALRHWFDTLKNPNKTQEQWHILSSEPLPDSK